MRIRYIEPTDIEESVKYLLVAHAGQSYTGYIGSVYFSDGVADRPLEGWEVRSMVNGVHIFPWQQAITVKWDAQGTPIASTPEAPVIKPVPVAAVIAEVKPTWATVPEPIKRKPGRPRKDSIE